MDEGTAALIAGLTGMVGTVGGAIAGGVLAVRGARIGGTKAVEAARVQVDGAAATGHLQWVRDQRQQAYARLLDAYAALDSVLMATAPRLRAGEGLTAETRLDLAYRTLTMNSCTAQLALWGPDEAVRLAQELNMQCVATAQALHSAQTEAPLASGESSPPWERWTEAKREMSMMHSAFVERVGQIIRDPEQPTA